MQSMLRNSAIPIKSLQEISRMRESCQIAAMVLDRLICLTEPGISTYEIDQEGKKLIDSYGAVSACYNYRIGNRCFPAYTCISVNEEVVHGIGSLKRILRICDMVTIDVTVIYQGFIGDNARTILLGEASSDLQTLGEPGTGKRLKPKMALAIEPMVNLGRPEVEMADDGWTAITRDRKPSAHFEHTVLVTENEPEILTLVKK